MLKITIKSEEHWDEELEEFIPSIKPVELTLEHSLISLSKWEEKWEKPYLSTELNAEQVKDYIRCMTLNQNIDLSIYEYIDNETIEKVTEYIQKPMTATWFREDKKNNGRGKLNGKVITSELLYCWMIQMGIPFECQKWHLNRLITLIRVIGEESGTKKKMSKTDVARQYATLNAQRRAKLGTKG